MTIPQPIQQYPVTPIFNTHSFATMDRYWNLVILPENYSSAEMDLFKADAEAVAQILVSTEPFLRLSSGINIFRIDIPNPPGGTPFDAQFGRLGVARFVYGDSSLVQAVVAAQTPLKNKTKGKIIHGYLVIINASLTKKVGGMTDHGVAWVSNQSPASGDWAKTAIHELGHQGFELGDEYTYWDKSTEHRVFNGGDPKFHNVTIKPKPTKLPWKDLINVTDLPTSPPNPGCKPVNMILGVDQRVGAFEGAAHYLCNIFRPMAYCAMVDEHQYDFCTVCQKVIWDELGHYLFQKGATQPERPCDLATEIVTYVPTQPNSTPRFLAYNLATGNYTVYDCASLVTGTTSNPINTASIEPGWTSLSLTQFQGKPHLLATQLSTDVAGLYQISDAGDTLKRVWMTSPLIARAILPLGLEQVVPFTANGKLHFLDHDPTKGFVIKRIDSLASPVITTVRKLPWSYTLPILAPFTLEKGLHFLTYDVATDAVRIDCFANDDVVVVWPEQKGFFKADWTTLMPFTLSDGTPCLMAHSAFTGAMHFYMIRSSGQGLDLVAKQSDSIGASIFRPFRLPANVPPGVPRNLPYYLRYRLTVGPVTGSVVEGFHCG